MKSLQLQLAVAALFALVSCTHPHQPGQQLPGPTSAYAHAEGYCYVTSEVRRLLALGDDADEAPFLRYEAYREAAPELFGPTPWPGERLAMVGEFAPADSLLLAYEPHDYDEIVGNILVAAVAQGSVRVLVRPAARARLEALLWVYDISADAIAIDVETGFDTVWIRDWGPQAVISGGGLGLVDGRFFFNCVQDDAAPTRMAASLGARHVHRAPILIEGGNLLSNGAGLCFSTTALVSANDFDEELVRAVLRDFYGCRQTVFLEPLHGNVVPHVDMFLSVAAEDRILLGQYTYGQDLFNHLVLEANAAALEAVRTVSGDPLTVLRVPMPDSRNDPVERRNGGPLIRSYLNLVPFNGVVLVPTYDDERSHEAAALRVIGEAFPGRTVVPIAVDDMAADNGTIHCITQTVPSVRNG